MDQLLKLSVTNNKVAIVDNNRIRKKIPRSFADSLFQSKKKTAKSTHQQMNSKLILVLILALIALVSAEQHCISKAFVARAIIADPKKSEDDTQHFWFDASTNRQRTDIRTREPVHKRISLYHRYDLGKTFEYDNSTGQCRSTPLTGSLQPFCLAQDAKLTRNITIGGHLKCQVWDETIQGLKMRLVIAPNPRFGIPVNIISRGGVHHTHVFQEWLDFQGFDTLPDQRVFDLPAPCQSLADKRSLSNNKETFHYENYLQFLVHQA
jgi:hypothetical protein